MITGHFRSDPAVQRRQDVEQWKISCTSPSLDKIKPKLSQTHMITDLHRDQPFVPFCGCYDCYIQRLPIGERPPTLVLRQEPYQASNTLTPGWVE